MFEKEIKELFELAWRVSNETDYFVSFYITSHVHLFLFIDLIWFSVPDCIISKGGRNLVPLF